MTSGADLAIAVGTIATAVVAVGGLFLSFHINKNDRRRADKQAVDDRAAAVSLAAADRAATREDAERRHIVDLLLELGRQIGRQAAYAGNPQSNEAGQRIILLLNALPAECAHTVRQKFNVNLTMAWPGAVGTKMGHLDLNAVGGNADTTQMNREIAFDIDRYLTSGKPPVDVWSDQADLEQWQRSRWPRS